MADPVKPVTIDWKTLKESTQHPFVGGAAPPPKMEILLACAHLIHAFVSQPYASQAFAMDPGEAGGTHWNFGQHLGPGTKAARPVFVRAPAIGDATAALDSQIWSDEQSATSQRVDVPSPHGQGADVFPPRIETAVAAKGSTEVVGTPSEGDNRAIEVDTPELNPQVRFYKAKNFSAVSIEPVQVGDLNSL